MEGTQMTKNALLKTLRTVLTVSLVSTVGFVSHLQADVTEKDTKAISQVLTLISLATGKIDMPAEVAVVDDGGAKADADKFKEFGDKNNLKVTVVSSANLGSTTAKAIFVPGTADAAALDAAYNAAVSKKIPTLSNSNAGVASQKVAIAVSTGGAAVNFEVSQAASKAVGVDFSSAFKMLITEKP